jgi:hypothetical protein
MGGFMEGIVNTAIPETRITKHQFLMKDLLPPIGGIMGGYVFLVSRTSLPPVFGQVIFYMAWFLFLFSTFTFLKIFYYLFVEATKDVTK